MVPLLSIFVAFLLGFVYPAVVPSPPPPDLSGVALLLLLSGLLFHLLMRSVARRALAAEGPPGLRVLRASHAVRTASVGVYALVVYGAHWPAVVERLGIGHWVLVDEIVVLGPFLVLLFLALLAAWSAERSVGLHEFGRGAYLSFALRQYLLPIAPVGFFILLQDLAEAGSRQGIRWVAEARITYQAFPFVQWITLAAVLFALYLLLPFVIRRLWGARPLPDGPLRGRLEAFSRAEGFRTRDILEWPTGGNVLNAAVVGPAGPFRYVLLTDGLLRALPEDEILAVYAHEVGHARHRHMLLYFLFTVGYALLAFLAGDALERWWRPGAGDPVLVHLAVWLGTFLLWFGTLFGFLSRRLEQQADVYGALAVNRHAPTPGRGHAFLSALEGLARQMGDIREAKGLRHFSLAERIDFLERFLRDPAVRRRYRRSMAGLLAFFFGLLLAIGGAAAATLPRQVGEGLVRSSLLRAEWHEAHGEHGRAARAALRALRAAREEGVGIGLGVLDGSEGPRERAMRLIDAVRGSGTPPPWYRALMLARLAEAYRALDMLAAARDSLTLALALAGDDPLLLADLGETLLAEGRPRGARLALEDARDLEPPDTPLAGRIRDLLATLPD